MTKDQTLTARKAFVRMMKEESFYGGCNHNLKAHWRGVEHGFATMHIQHRWEDFLAGFEAAINLVREKKITDRNTKENNNETNNRP